MTRSSKAELEQRVDEVFELVVSRVTYRAILTYCASKWAIGERQARVYLAKARERIVELAKESEEERLAKAQASYEALFRKQMAAARLNDARRTLDSIVNLLGLAAPSRSEVSHSGEIALEEKRSLLVERIMKEVEARQGAADDEKER